MNIATEGEVTTREAAARLGVSPRTVTRYVRTGLLSARRVSATGRSGVFLIPVAQLDGFDPDANGRPPRLSDELLTEVSRMWVSAFEAGDSPRQHIAEEYGRSVNTIDGWIAAARRRGFLKPYER